MISDQRCSWYDGEEKDVDVEEEEEDDEDLVVEEEEEEDEDESWAVSANLKNYIWEHFQTLTPKYDLESLSDCLRDAAARSTSEQEAGNIFDTMSKGSDTLSKTKFREFLKKDAELKVRVFGRVDVPWKEVYRKIDANHDGKFSKLEFVLAFVRAEQSTNTLLGTVTGSEQSE